MPIVATVTRSGGGVRFFSQSPSNVGNQGGVGFTLRKANGESLGMYQSVASAQAAFNAFHGQSRIFRWERRDLPGAIEQHVCIGTPLDPRDVWQLQPAGNQVPNAQPVTSIITWIEPDAVVGSVKLSAATPSGVIIGTVRAVNDIGGNGGGSWSSTGDPLLTRADVLYKGRRVLNFDGVDDAYNNPNVGDWLAPASIFVAATPTVAADTGIVLRQSTEWELRLNAGVWELEVDGNTIVGPTASVLQMDIVTIVASETGTELRVNGVSAGSIVDVIDDTPTSYQISVEFQGVLGALVSVDGVDRTKILQTERYLTERWR